MQQPARSIDNQLSMRLRWTFVLSFLLLFLASAGVVSAACIGVDGEAAVSACRDELGSNPRNLEVRLALATALDRLGRKDEALKVLDLGLAVFRGDEASRSILEEKRWNMQRQPKSNTASDAATRVKIIKCKTLKGSTALKACEDGLSSLPDNTDLLAGKGDALLGLTPPKVIDAIRSYKKALVIVPANKDIRHKLEYAESLRQKTVSTCMSGTGSAALAACDSGLLKGASDEAAIYARRGDLLVAMNQDKNAIEAYRIALQLEPGNSAARQAIDRLTAVKELPKPAPSPPPPRKPAPPELARIFSNAPISNGITY